MIQYTYELAMTELHPNKQGVNRTSWEDNESSTQSEWTRLTKEYFPVDPRTQPSVALQAVMDATPEDIDKIKKILGIL